MANSLQGQGGIAVYPRVHIPLVVIRNVVVRRRDIVWAFYDRRNIDVSLLQFPRGWLPQVAVVVVVAAAVAADWTPLRMQR